MLLVKKDAVNGVFFVIIKAGRIGKCKKTYEFSKIFITASFISGFAFSRGLMICLSFEKLFMS